jgi:hypothetical protein
MFTIWGPFKNCFIVADPSETSVHLQPRGPVNGAKKRPINVVGIPGAAPWA